MATPYNPLDKMNLGRSVAEALLFSPVVPLTQIPELVGAGVYAIYYADGFEAYGPVAEKNQNSVFEQPIYVGKAVPKGARKGGLSFDASKGRALRDRLRQHAGSIDEAANLDLADFHFRSLIVDDIWIPLGENMMIEQFRPIWNLVIDGFGNKDPGKRRATQYRSPWDVLHPGRQFAEKLATGGTTAEMLVTRLKEYFAGQIVPLVPRRKRAILEQPRMTRSKTDGCQMSVPVIYRLTIERFRGIKSFSWHPAKGVNLILGGGDVPANRKRSGY